MKIPEFFRFFGIAGGAIFWIFTGWSIYRNPWFDFFQNALSDLGDISANSPWIYNCGLIITAIFMMLFSVYLLSLSGNKLQTIGASYISVSAIFLALIGVFHSGTRPHTFISTYFFIQFFIGMLVFGLGSRRKIRNPVVLIFLLAVLGTFVPWPSAALVETYEIILIIIFTLLISFSKKV